MSDWFDLAINWWKTVSLAGILGTAIRFIWKYRRPIGEYIVAWFTLPFTTKRIEQKIDRIEDEKRKIIEDRRQTCLSCGDKDTELISQTPYLDGPGGKWVYQNLYACKNCGKRFYPKT